MTPPDDLQAKLNSLTVYLDELEEWLAPPNATFNPKGMRRILERMVQLVVECTADAGDIWLQEYGHPPGESVRGVFERLRETQVLTDVTADRFAQYVSLRNRIVHDYERVSPALLLQTAPGILSDCRALSLRFLSDPADSA